MSEAEIWEIARAREKINEGGPGQFFRTPLKCYVTGVRGEVAFAHACHISDERIRRVERGSDGGFDLEVFFDHGKYGKTRLRFDVKTREDDRREDLLVPAVKFQFGRCADFMVLGRCIGRKVQFLGWEDPLIVGAMPIQTKEQGFKCDTHVRERKRLRSMRDLMEIMQRHEGWESYRETPPAP